MRGRSVPLLQLSTICWVTAWPLVSYADDSLLDPQDARAIEEPAATRWYGWQILAADGGAAALVALSLATESDHHHIVAGPIFYTAYVAWVVSGPVVHGAHGNLGSALTSGVARLGVSLLVGWLLHGALTPQEEGTEEASEVDPYPNDFFAIGLALSMLPVGLIDAAALARAPIAAAEGASSSW